MVIFVCLLWLFSLWFGYYGFVLQWYCCLVFALVVINFGSDSICLFVVCCLRYVCFDCLLVWV